MHNLYFHIPVLLKGSQMNDYSRYISNLHRSNPDIAATVTKKYSKLMIVWLLWTALVTVLQYLWLFDYFSSRVNFVSAIIVYIFMCILPFFIKKSWRLIFDKTWVGKVVSVKYDRVVKSTPTSSRKIIYVNTLEMVIECGNKVRTIVLPCANASAIYPFEVGDIVCHYKGTKYPVFAVESKTKAQLCPLCGTIHKPHECECFWCHHSVIKPMNIVN